MSKIPMQPWYPDAHIAETSNLTLEEQGAYRLLMDHMWRNHAYIRDNDKDIARMLRVSVKRWVKIKKRLESFLMFDSGRITQKRLLKDYLEACEKSKRNAENGKIGGQKTAEKHKSAQTNALASNGDWLLAHHACVGRRDKLARCLIS